MPEHKTFYSRNYPHLHPKGGTFFITYRLYGSIPFSKLNKLREEFELKMSQTNPESQDAIKSAYHKQREELQTKIYAGPKWLSIPEIAHIVKESLHFFDGVQHELIAYTIMSNHVHFIIKPFEIDESGKPVWLPNIMRSIKGVSANKCNKLLNRTGQFWQHESYDHYIRDQKELSNTIGYILDNPIKAGMCNNRKDWPWNYVKQEYNDFL